MMIMTKRSVSVYASMPGFNNSSIAQHSISNMAQPQCCLEHCVSTVQEDSLRQSESKTKELEEEKNRLQKTSTAQHTQLDKYKKMSDDRQSLAESLETQVSALKKVRDFSLRFV